MRIASCPIPTRRRRPIVRAMASLVAVVALASCSATSGQKETAEKATTTGAATSEETTTSQAGAGSPQPDAVGCETVDPAAWKVAPTGDDLATMVGAGRFPAPYQPTAEAGEPTTGDLFPTPDDFLAQSNVQDTARRKQVMEAAGFRGGIKAHWDSETAYEVQILDFADASGAADYFAERLPNLCMNGGTQAGVVPLEGGGITWTDPLGATHGEFIMGGSQVSLTLCSCDGAGTVDTVLAWHQAWTEQFASGPAAPITR